MKNNAIMTLIKSRILDVYNENLLSKWNDNNEMV